MQHDWTLRSQTLRALSEALLEARARSDTRAGQVLEHLVERYLDLTTGREASGECCRNENSRNESSRDEPSRNEHFRHLADAAASIRRRVGAGMWDRA